MATPATAHRGFDPPFDGPAQPHASRHGADPRHPEQSERSPARQEGAEHRYDPEIACPISRASRPAAAAAQESVGPASDQAIRSLTVVVPLRSREQAGIALRESA